MVLQRIEGCSDREAVDRFAFDARWKYAAGGLDFDYPGFVHTVLVDMRARLARSARPDRIFEVTLAAARQAGLVGRRRVLDSTPLYDAVATMDTVTLVRSAIRGLLRAATVSWPRAARGAAPRRRLRPRASRPATTTIRRRVRSWSTRWPMTPGAAGGPGRAGAGPGAAQAAALLATVTGQDLEQDADGVFRIARRVAPDRVISTVDPQARHGHKTSIAGSTATRATSLPTRTREIVTATKVTAGNSGDAEVAEGLLADLLPGDQDSAGTGTGGQGAGGTPAGPGTAAGGSGQAAVYGDAAYGSGELVNAWKTPVSTAASRCSRRPRSRSLPQGPLRHRPRRKDRDLPGGHHRAHPGQRPRPPRRGSQVRRGLPHLPAGRPVHHRQRRPHDRHRPARGPAGRRPPGPGQPGLAGGLQGHPAQGGTQDRPPDAPPPRRAPCPGPRPARSPPTSPCSPPPSTSPGSRCSDWPTATEPGSPAPDETRRSGHGKMPRPGWPAWKQPLEAPDGTTPVPEPSGDSQARLPTSENLA